MNTTQKSNLKRIRGILLTDETENDDVRNDQDSDSDDEFDPAAPESDDTSAYEHVSEESNSSCSDDDQDTAATGNQPETLEKAGVTWSRHPNPAHGRISATSILKKKAGPTTKVQTITDTFKLFFTNEILDHIVLHTNLYADRYFDRMKKSRQDSNPIRSNSRQWKPVDRVELESFIGLLFQSGVNRSNHELLSDLWDISQSRPLFRATMSLQRFQQLLQFLRFDDRLSRDRSDRLSPVRFIFERFAKQLSQHFVPSENLTIDEQLVPFRGRCCFVQYMPKKPAKYGLKFWLLCDADSRYVLALDLYTGKKDNVVQKNLATGVVLRLVDRLPRTIQQGRTVTFDRYFTDINLSNGLLDRQMTSIGVVEHRRRFLPNELKVCRNELFSSWFYFVGPHMLLSYQAKEKKKPIIILSSAHAYPETFDDKKKLPCVIHDYNQTKSGVDAIDQCIGYYTVRRISRRWPMIVFYNMIDIAAINSMTIWLSENPEWNMRRTNTRRKFLVQLSLAMAESQNQRRSQEARLMPKVKLALMSLGYRLHSEIIENVNVNTHPERVKKRCYICPAKLGRKVRQTCHMCEQNVCLSHSRSVTVVTCDECEEKN